LSVETQIVNGSAAALGLGEHVLHFAEDGSALGFVLHLGDGLKLLQQFALALS
jgi:hypothetical protein